MFYTFDLFSRKLYNDFINYFLIIKRTQKIALEPPEEEED
ncbi:hypothetical protein FACS1894151_10500 [Spirochaetia bacterium]|nr:hypothetical protein FACS1894151_10500 [Spirochaetia bacterium]